MQKLYSSFVPFYQTVLRPYILVDLPPNPSNFNFELNGGPFARMDFMVTCLVAYISLVQVYHWKLRPIFANFNKTHFDTIQSIFIVHNFCLSFCSTILLALILENHGPRLLKHGVMWGICHEDSYEQDHRLEMFYYFNYLFKYYELLDTVLLMVKGKKLDFLHWYHHSATLLLCYVQLQGRTSVSWIPIGINLTVHVAMYYYYAMTAILRKPLWWKKYLTSLQILQFVIDLFFIHFAILVEALHRYDQEVRDYTGISIGKITWSFFGQGLSPSTSRYGGDQWYSQQASCYGTEMAAFVGWATISSYLLLFIQFFFATYNNKKPGSNSKIVENSDKLKLN